MDAISVEIILKEMSRISSKIFKAVPFIPHIAKECKKGIDQILLNYKRSVNNNLRYIVKSDKIDLKVMVRAFDKYDFLPSRELDINIL